MNKNGNYLSFIKRSKIIHNDFYKYDKVIYLTARLPVIINCSLHGDFKQRPDNHLSGKGCKICGIDKLKVMFTKSKEDFVIQCNLKYNNKYNYDESVYINDSTKLFIRCPLHGNFELMANKHINGRECPSCKKNTYNNRYKNKFLESVKNIHGNRYDYSKVEYIKANILVDIICKKHGVFSQTPKSHLTGNGCSNCSNSIGEKKVESYLRDNKINFSKNKKFDDCKNKVKLRFDFYLYDINTIIEFDGIQHFKPIEYFGGQVKLEYTIQNDNIKNNYCLKNGIKLIRISYLDIKKIKDILDRNL